MKLSIIVPVYNEEKTIKQVLKTILKTNLDIEKEIIVVNDGSTDNTMRELGSLNKKKYNIINLPKNDGKGSAIRKGIEVAKGEIITIHDADLEYETRDLKKLIEPIKQEKEKVVYGSRFFKYTSKKNKFYYGNKFLSIMTSIIYFKKITDMETCYKVFDAFLLKSLELNSRRFEFEPEVTAKILRQGINILEIPISYNPRDKKAGKKIKPLDGIHALWTLMKYRFIE